MNDKEKTKPCMANCFGCADFRPAGLLKIFGRRDSCVSGGCAGVENTRQTVDASLATEEKTTVNR